MGNDRGSAREYRASIVALYHHFLVYVDGCGRDVSQSFSAASIADRLALNGCIAAIQTVSSGTFAVSVHLAIVEQRPPLQPQMWSHITEFSLDVDSGRLIIADALYAAAIDPAIDLAPGTYRFRVAHQDIPQVTAAYYRGDVDATEHIWLQVWPERSGDPKVLKRYPE